MEYKTYNHNPPHLFSPNTKYFVTGTILNHYRLLHSEKTKEKLLDYIIKSVTHFDWIFRRLGHFG